MIRFVAQRDIDTEAWDRCIKSDVSGHFYAYHWYLDMLAKDWDALVYGDYESVMPLIRGRKFVFSYLYRPFGVQQLGIFGAHAENEEIVQSFIAQIPRHYLLIDIFLNAHNPIPEKMAKGWNQNLEIRLEHSYEHIFEHYSKNTRRNIKKAKKAGLSLVENDSPEQLIRLFEKNKGAELAHFTDWHYARMKQIMYVLIHRKMGSVWSVYDEHNTICASVFFAWTSKRVVFLFSGQDSYGREHGGMSKIIDEMLLWSVGNLRVFDFEGSNDPGLARFYKGFGAKPVKYAGYKKWWWQRF